MGLRASVSVIATSFLLGIVYTHWIADSLTLWQSPLTDAHLRTAVTYYGLFATQPIWMTGTLVGVTLIGATSLLASFREGASGNLMFDGASLFLYACTVVVYWGAVVPNLAEINSYKLPLTPNDDFPSSLQQPTIELATSHLICSVALTGVLFMQAGRAWAQVEDEAEAVAAKAEEAERQLRRSNSTDGARGRRKEVPESETDSLEVPPTLRIRPSSKRRDGTTVKSKIPRSASRARRQS